MRVGLEGDFWRSKSVEGEKQTQKQKEHQKEI